MILKKPYKFFMKNFKIISFVLVILNIYIINNTYNSLAFFYEYINSSSLISTDNIIDQFFNILIFVIPIIFILIVSITIYLLKKQKKSIKWYIFILVIYIAILIFEFYFYHNCQILQTNILDIRILKILNDLLLIVLILEIISLLFFLIKASGFNIKTFRFDCSEFDIETFENDEVEFDLSIDTNKVTRHTKRNLRYIKYVYIENKVLINFALVGLLIMICVFKYFDVNIFNKKYNMNEEFTINNINVNVVNSYITDKGYNNKIITENNLVVVKIKAKSFEKNINLNTLGFTLVVNNISFNHTTKYKKELIDIGDVYNKQLLKDDYKSYILVFEIPKNFNDDKMILKCNYSNNKSLSVKLDNEEFLENKINDSANLTEELVIKNDIIDTKLKIKNFEINDKFKIYYNFKYNNINYLSYEYLLPSYIDNYDRTIIKLNATLENENFVNFMERFCKIEYQIDNVNKVMNIELINEIPKKTKTTNDYYFSISNEIKYAEKITLVFNIRGNIYKYYLK